MTVQTLRLCFYAIILCVFGGKHVLLAQTYGTFKNPFSADSIWNTKIGSDATYGSTGFSAAVQKYWVPEDIGIHLMKSSDPLRNTYEKTSDSYCASVASTIQYSLNIPDNLVVSNQKSNGIYCFISSNGYVRESYLWQRCSPGSHAGGRFAPSDLYSIGGNGLPGRGVQLGSKLIGFGGTVRLGELTTPGVPIPHMLKILLHNSVMDYDPNSPTPGYKWPAKAADGDAGASYTGTNPNVVMGAILALPRTFDLSKMLTEPGKKIAEAMREYGGIVVDTSGATSMPKWHLGMELGVPAELAATYGIKVSEYFNASYSNQATANFKKDLDLIYNSLKVITNNSPTAPKGPGSSIISSAPAAPANLAVQ